jgi:hypothetical protein
MNMNLGKLCRLAKQIATGFSLTLQAIIQRKLTIRTKTIMCAQPVYPKAPSGISKLHGHLIFSQQDI